MYIFLRKKGVRPISRQFCAICGISEDPFVDNLCETCYKKEKPLDVETIKQIEVEICSSCGTMRIQGKRFEPEDFTNIEEAIREIVKGIILEKLRIDGSYKHDYSDDIDEEKINYKRLKRFNVATTITAKPLEEFGEFTAILDTKVNISRMTCDTCSKYKAGYFEAILQVRGENRQITEKEEARLEELINIIMKKYEGSRMAYILEYDIDKKGITAKISTKMLAEELARAIKQKTAGKSTTAYELKTKARDGTDVYQNTYLVRLPKFAIEDVIEFENEVWVIRGIIEKQIKLESLENHVIKKFDRRRVERDGRRRFYQIVERKFMVISFKGNMATIMAMDNYENFEEKIEKLPKSVKEGQSVEGFLYEDRNYYLTLVETDDI